MPTSVVLSTENCASLSNLYWSLWRLMGGTAELQQPVQAPMEDIVQSGTVCSDFRIAREYLQGGPGSASAELREVLHEGRLEGRHWVLVVDEAQDGSDELFESIRTHIFYLNGK